VITISLTLWTDLPAGVSDIKTVQPVCGLATHCDVQTAADITEVSGDANGSEMDQEADK